MTATTALFSANRSGRASSAPSARSWLHQIQGRFANAFVPAAAVYQHQREWSASCRAGFIQIVLDFAKWFLPRFVLTSLLNWRGLRSASFSRPHSHWLAMSLPSQLVRQSAFAGARHITNSMASRVSSTARLNTLAHKHLSQAVADALHFHLKRPFQSRFVCWFNKCQQARSKNWEFRTSRSRVK